MGSDPGATADKPSSWPLVVTLCTGNAARSVMAGAMLVPARVRILTAGTHVVEGQPMSRRTRAALASVELRSDGHRSRQLTDAMVESADLIVALACEHVAYIRRTHPEAANRTATLRRLVRDLPAGSEPLSERVSRLHLDKAVTEPWEDVDDPAGGEDDAYVACALDLVELTTSLVPRLG